jgi:hypothetical protein
MSEVVKEIKIYFIEHTTGIGVELPIAVKPYNVGALLMSQKFLTRAS